MSTPATSYRARIADDLLKERLARIGAVLIRGPKWCGKTSTAERAAASALYMDDPDFAAEYLELADTKPSLLLQGNTPRLLDEWQTAPVLWDAVRHAVDRRNMPGQFILTGSAVPADDVVQHTGTGRISRLTMRTMSLYESGDSNGQVSLTDLFSGTTDGEAVSDLTLERAAFAIARGGWPEAVNQPEKNAIKLVSDYVDAIVESDVSRADEGIRDPARIASLLKSIARNISQPASMSTLRADTAMGDVSILSVRTVARYMAALQRIFVVEDLPAWSPALRSRTPVRSAPKRQFTDPSIALAALGRSEEILLEDFEYFGFLFESLCIRDLRIYADALDGHVFYYRDKTDLEADAVVVLRDGRWGAIEIKLGSRSIDEGAAHLLKLASERVDTEKIGRPSFLMVLTAGQYGYQRRDGVYITPIGCLKP